MYGAVDFLVCPPSVYLIPVAEVVKGTKVALGAQNVYFQPNGAFTGELSTAMLVDAGCSDVILGHSERRQYFNETNEQLAEKVNLVLQQGMTPIFCCGETLEQRQKEQKGARSIRCALRSVDIYRLLWPRTSFLTFFFLEPRGSVRFALGAAFLRAARFSFLRSCVSSIFVVFAITCLDSENVVRLFERSRLHPLELGKLLHKLLHAELRELYCNLRVVAVALAAEDHAVPILGMPDALSALETDNASWLWDRQLGPLRARAHTAGKEARDVIDRARITARLAATVTSFLTISTGRGRALIFIFVTVVALPIVVEMPAASTR